MLLLSCSRAKSSISGSQFFVVGVFFLLSQQVVGRACWGVVKSYCLKTPFLPSLPCINAGLWNEAHICALLSDWSNENRNKRQTCLNAPAVYLVKIFMETMNAEKAPGGGGCGFWERMSQRSTFSTKYFTFPSIQPYRL